MKDPRLYLLHIIESIDKIEKYTAAGEAAFHSDNMAQDAVVRNFEIIGEAVKRISEDIRAKASEIPWRRIAGFRDILIHQYEGVNWKEVWRIAEKELPAMKAGIQILLDKPSDQGSSK